MNAESPHYTPLHQLIDQQVSRSPANVAVVATDGTLTYQELHERTNQLAHRLVQLGIKPGDVIGLALDRSTHLLVALLGIMKTGAVYLPIDPTYPPARIAFMLTDAAATYLLTSQHYQDQMAGPAVALLSIEILLEEAVHCSQEVPPCTVLGRDLVYILHTSGSSGKPKGVLIEHRNLVNVLISMIAWPGITAADRLLAVTTISFDIAGLELYLPLLVGATVVLADTPTTRDGKALLKLAHDQRITMIQATPITYKLMLAAGWVDRLPFTLLCCGEPLPKDLARQLLPRCHALWNMYGPTETTIYSTGKHITNPEEPITIGFPIHHTRVYIVDENLAIVPKGGTGELAIAGEGVARGYLNRPAQTRDQFIEHPAESDSRLYRTGDLGRLTTNGELEYLGRLDQQVKIRGHRVEPGEIEQVLLTQATIRDAVVVARADRSGTPRLVAYIVCPSPLPESAFRAETSRWQAGIKAVLPAYMLPTAFIQLTRLPVTLNGKTDRKALATDPALTGSVATQASSPVPSPLVTITPPVQSIWAKLMPRWYIRRSGNES